ncbi:MAG TPA: hypothetical protein DEB40_12980 [Elusimicrobia bacterium]|nr:hypothetical protein [Elusimicrobiota bacterium]HBT62648.1 hypothetical protein [Elusimicrobiota bacterium]
MRNLQLSILALLIGVPAQARIAHRRLSRAVVPCAGQFRSGPVALGTLDAGPRFDLNAIAGRLKAGPVLQKTARDPAAASLMARPHASEMAAPGTPLAPAIPVRPSVAGALVQLGSGLRESEDGGQAEKTLSDRFFDQTQPADHSGFAAAGAGSTLEPGAWLAENRGRLERLIAEYGRGGPKWNPDSPPLATFDWDNTMIRNDVAEALFYHLIREMKFKFALGDRFWNLIPAELGRDEIRANYEAVKDLPLARAKNTPQYRRYRKLFHRAYEEAQARYKELHLDFSWFVELMTGFSVAEVERASDETIAEELERPLGEELIRENDSDPRPIAIRTGLRPNAEMFDLVAKLRAAGWDVRIVSGSNEWTVARFAARAGLPREKVHGVLSRVEDGKLTEDVLQRTWGQGKADVILKKAGRPSLLAAGDSRFDIEMLRLSAGEKLVIDRGDEKLRSIAEAEGWMRQPPFPVAVGRKPRGF